MKKNKTTNFMAFVFITIFVGFFLILTGRFLYIQATGEIEGVSLDKWAKEKRSSSYTLEAERGKIFDSKGMVLAYDRPAFRIYAITRESYSDNSSKKRHVVDPEETAAKLAPILDADEQDLLETLKNGIEQDRFQVEFGRAGQKISQTQKEEIEALELPGIHFTKESLRYYPNGMFASHIIGFARETEPKTEDDKTINQITGITGMEKEMNKLLQGKDGYISFQRDNYNRKLLHPDEVVKKPDNGDDVYLTIDQKIQTLLDDVMSQVDEHYSPKRMTAIVMDAKTGEIKALSNRPSYDPNNPTDVENWYNDAISTPFEPGSTMKMFTWAAAIEEGVYNGDEVFQSGSYQINSKVQKVRDHNGGRGWGKITFDEGFQRSSNVAASKLLWEKIGADKYLEYLKAFKLFEKTGIDLPGEVSGQLLYNWPRDKLSTSFGQGSTVTPIQQMKAATAIANDGKMLQPYVINKIVNPNTGEIIKENKPQVVAEPISKKTADHVMELLGTVVSSENGTGKMFALDNYTLAGKTGTAQIPNPKGGYLTGTGNNIYSFMGMAPLDDPQLIMYVSVKQPDLETEDGIEAGSAPVSYIFKNVMENSLHYLDIEPDIDEDQKSQLIQIPELEGMEVAEAKAMLSEKGLHVTISGKGKKIIASNVIGKSELLPNSRVFLVTDKPTMPNMKGWSIREVLQFADVTGLKLETIGSGYVTKQGIKEGKSIKKGDYLGVELKPPQKKKAKKPKKESSESDAESTNHGE
ncbi:penicillin-binding protein [Ornithinibacillus gellani]|uniref:penicillin-binding protein n=1 Tax=Ornithinibacillus gellani TaxID=2293253 RepID=UPI000F46B539|nr:penicillin-binding protein [Ornithinibacillus gellani]TQS75656.1 penicillin-binding protein [Ornithinibacillus gellani]